eukprot:1140807-Pelagomonas_calceolata.AAC.2
MVRWKRPAAGLVWLLHHKLSKLENPGKNVLGVYATLWGKRSSGWARAADHEFHRKPSNSGALPHDCAFARMNCRRASAPFTNAKCKNKEEQSCYGAADKRQLGDPT